jgi:hypothetical protein
VIEIIIDGVKYVPAASVVANENDFAKALLSSFSGHCRDENLAKEMKGITVSVNDWGDGIPVRDILDNLAEIATKRKSGD